MEDELLHYDPSSIMRFTDAELAVQLDMMRHLSVADATTEKPATLEELWSKSSTGTLFVWLRHFGWCAHRRDEYSAALMRGAHNRATCQLKVTLLAQRWQDFVALGYDVCLIGLGSAKTALKYTSHLKFPGQITVDPSLTTYRSMGWDNNSGLAAAKTASRAADKLKQCATCPDANTFLIGGGLLSASQNGGYMAVTRDGKRIPFGYRQSDSGDMPDLDVLLAALRA